VRCKILINLKIFSVDKKKKHSRRQKMVYASHLPKPFFTSLPHPQADNCESASNGAHLLEQVGCTRALSQLHAQIVNNRTNNCIVSRSYLRMPYIFTHFFALQLIFIVFLSSSHLFRLYENI